jgi:hypothetical protein
MSASTTGAAPVNFITFRGNPVKIAALTLAQQDDLADWMRYTYIQDSKKQMIGLPVKLLEFAWTAAKAKADRIYPGRLEHAELFHTPSGTVYGCWLALQKHNPTMTKEDAAELMDTASIEDVEAVRAAVGYRADGTTRSSDRAIPIKEILHALTNEPYCHTPAEVRAMTLDEIATVWTKPEDGQPVFTQSDQDRWIAEANANAEKRKLGIWSDDGDIWK